MHLLYFFQLYLFKSSSDIEIYLTLLFKEMLTIGSI